MKDKIYFGVLGGFVFTIATFSQDYTLTERALCFGIVTICLGGLLWWFQWTVDRL